MKSDKIRANLMNIWKIHFFYIPLNFLEVMHTWTQMKIERDQSEII